MLTLVHETPYELVVLKPYGMDAEHELPAQLASECGGRKEDYYCIHRLDKTASGLLVYGKTKSAASLLSKAVQKNRLKKQYLIIVDGCPEETEGTYQDLLYKDRIKQKMFPVRKMRNGVKDASLTYKVLRSVNAEEKTFSLIQVTLQTGRFHQIRVQFASRHMPLIGDGKYGSRISSPHLALFCHALAFPDSKSGKEIFCQVPLPAEYPWTLFDTSSIFS